MFRYESSAYPDDRAFEIYRSLISDVFDAWRPADDRRPFAASVQAWTLGDLFLHRGTHMRIEFERSREKIREDGLDDLAIMLVDEGFWSGDCDGRSVHSTPGTLTIFDRTRPMQLTGADNRSSIINVPRYRLVQMGCAVDDLHGRVFDGAVVSLIGSLIEAIGRDGVPDRTGETLGDTLVALTATLVNADSGAPRDVIPEKVAARTRTFIDRNLDDDELTPAVIAASLGVSRSALYREFESVGGVVQFIRERRLVAARQILSDNAHASISQVAFDVGFRNAAHFSTAYKARFGVSPRDSARGKHASAATDAQSLTGEVRMSRWRLIASRPELRRVDENGTHGKDSGTLNKALGPIKR